MFYAPRCLLLLYVTPRNLLSSPLMNKKPLFRLAGKRALIPLKCSGQFFFVFSWCNGKQIAKLITFIRLLTKHVIIILTLSCKTIRRHYKAPNILLQLNTHIRNTLGITPASQDNKQGKWEPDIMIEFDDPTADMQLL
jgi:hypothetical protein